MSRRRARALLTPGGVELLAAALAVAALGLLVWPVSLTVPDVNRAVPAAPAPPPAMATGDPLSEALVATNLFSGSRRAPRERFRLPGTEPVPDVPGAFPMVGAADADAWPQLFGVVQMDGAARALVQVAGDSTPRLLAVGDRAGPWQLRRIGPDRVTLTSASGTRLVRLSRRSPSDSAGSRP